MKHLFTLFLCFASVFHMHAQSLSLFDVDASNFPTMKAKFYAFDAGGKQVRPSATELSISENGVNRPITSVLCQLPIPTKAVSVAISIDVSGSMNHSNFKEIPIELSKLTATTLCRQIVMPPSEFALQICDTKPYIIQDFTANKYKTLQAINQITAAAGNDFVEQMLNKLAGLLNIAKNGTHKKVAVLCTDAGGLFFKTDEIQACVDTCKKYNIEFYAVVFQGKEQEPIGIQQSLQPLANQTGGYVFDKVTSKAEAEQIASEIQQKSQGATPCEITWTSDISCHVGDAIAELAWMNSKSQSTYSPPANAIASLIANPAFAAFGKCLPSTQHDTTIKLTAQNADYKVTGIRRKFGSTAFSIVNTSFPFIVPKNSERTITIRFAPSDSAMQYASFQIETDKCSSYFSAGGGFPTKKTTNPTLKLTKPNGGETYVVGSDSLITWDGISPSDSVVLEYSIDNGISWKILQTKATNLEYIWKNIPKPASSQCKVRVKKKVTEAPRIVQSGNYYLI